MSVAKTKVPAAPAAVPAAVLAADPAVIPADAATVQPLDFAGAVRTDNTLPSTDVLQRIADIPVLAADGTSQPFRSLCADGRTLVLFVRHFFCGNCQEYLRTLSAELPPTALPSDTRIVVVGCGEPVLIPMYIEASACAYPVFADPTRRLYDELGMVSTLALGPQKPAYMAGRSMLASTLRSIGQGLRQIPSGLTLKGGNQRQVGGEFLFVHRGDALSVSWCHRMKTTRDHAEAAEIRVLLGLSHAVESETTT